ncbi:uncharacterized protein L203_104406 [Cryptococcus depauperatus CBS 7841]|uniref:Plastocyanin-like domain-containing protein n=1 Tax=Cryptococcus depauperatus CBS 7841 TaxID=1295531 RepID=A0AAJ8M279_9TREE
MDSGRPSSSILGTVQAGTTLSPGTRNLSSSWLTGTSALSLPAHARRYHEEYPVLERRDFLNWVNPTGAEPVPDSAVIYGAWKNGTTFSTPSEISAGTGVSDHASLLFTPGKSYRIHMVNMGGLAMFWVALQDHQVYIIEADGVEVEPLPVDAATFSVAQRYSLWVQAKDTGDRNYALYDTVPPLLVLNNTVQVVYNASALAATAWIPSNIPTFNDTQLVPLHALPLLQPDVKITLNAYFESFDVTSDDPVINPVAIDEGQKNPARRDTVVIPGGGSATLRWRADNPGAWMFHCHIDWHLSSGLAAVLVEAPERFAEEKANVPERIYDHCRAWKMGTEGNVVGTYSVSDFDGQPWGPFPLKMGWTRRAIGALAGCILTALIGMATIGWYASGELDEEEMEAEVRWAVNKGLRRGTYSLVSWQLYDGFHCLVSTFGSQRHGSLNRTGGCGAPGSYWDNGFVGREETVGQNASGGNDY